eukprot:TRINITY_DN2105_c1_g1_i2.p1 TRINITY_DN2105_c1_g1~~TRINITY_DN2105_c1_g1_i2.p1  ORF type:complete len:1492 (+),score=226.36 TRINITY_DN2105_c1_g1_i2:221-4696(+)
MDILPRAVSVDQPPTQQSISVTRLAIESSVATVLGDSLLSTSPLSRADLSSTAHTLSGDGSEEAPRFLIPIIAQRDAAAYRRSQVLNIKIGGRASQQLQQPPQPQQPQPRHSTTSPTLTHRATHSQSHTRSPVLHKRNWSAEDDHSTNSDSEADDNDDLFSSPRDKLNATAHAWMNRARGSEREEEDDEADPPHNVDNDSTQNRERLPSFTYDDALSNPLFRGRGASLSLTPYSERGGTLVLIGAPGSGKTAVWNALVKRKVHKARVGKSSSGSDDDSDFDVSSLSHSSAYNTSASASMSSTSSSAKHAQAVLPRDTHTSGVTVVMATSPPTSSTPPDTMFQQQYLRTKPTAQVDSSPQGISLRAGIKPALSEQRASHSRNRSVGDIAKATTSNALSSLLRRGSIKQNHRSASDSAVSPVSSPRKTTLSVSGSSGGTSAASSKPDKDGRQPCNGVVLFSDISLYPVGKKVLRSNPINLRVLDFHSENAWTACQFFLTQRSLVLLTFDLTSPTTPSLLLLPWLRLLQRGDNPPPVVLVGTHADDKGDLQNRLAHIRTDINNVGLAFPNVVALATVGCKSKRGFNSLRRILYAQAVQLLSPLTDSVAVPNLKYVVERLNKEKDARIPVVPFAKYSELADELNVNSKEFSAITAALHKDGHIFHYDTDNMSRAAMRRKGNLTAREVSLVVLGTWVFLDICWLAHILLLVNKQSKLACQTERLREGMITLEHVHNTWKRAGVPSELHQPLITLFEEMALLFVIQPTKHQVLVIDQSSNDTEYQPEPGTRPRNNVAQAETPTAEQKNTSHTMPATEPATENSSKNRSDFFHKNPEMRRAPGSSRRVKTVYRNAGSFERELDIQRINERKQAKSREHPLRENSKQELVLPDNNESSVTSDTSPAIDMISPRRTLMVTQGPLQLMAQGNNSNNNNSKTNKVDDILTSSRGTTATQSTETLEQMVLGDMEDVRIFLPHLVPATVTTTQLAEAGWKFQTSYISSTSAAENRKSSSHMPMFPTIGRSRAAVVKTRFYSLPSYPISFFTRLLIRLLDTLDVPLYWQYGLVAHKDGNKALVEVQIDSLNAEGSTAIAVSISELEPACALWELLDFHITNVASHNFSLTPTVTICCPHCINSSSPLLRKAPHLFSMSECERAIAKGHSYLTCCHAENTAPVSVLLSQLMPNMGLTCLESWEMNYSDLQDLQSISKGNYSSVYRGIYKKETVAVKVFDPQMDNDLDSATTMRVIREFRAEALLLSGLKHHPNIIRLIGVCSKQPLALVMEFANGGTLTQLLQDHAKRLTWRTRLTIALQIARGMDVLHAVSPPIIHRDLKSTNILIATDEHGAITAKINDFGLSTAFSIRLGGREVDNPLWLAPEVMVGEEYTEKSDVYSFGMTLWEIYSRQMPFNEYQINFLSALEERIAKGLRPTIHNTHSLAHSIFDIAENTTAAPAPTTEACPQEFAELICQCWSHTPETRPSFLKIVKVLTYMCQRRDWL